MSTVSIQQPIAPASSAGRYSRMSSVIWVSLALWVASILFVNMVSRLATWEGMGIALYHGSADLCRWDCHYYAMVMEHGYGKTPVPPDGFADWPFHPVFPLTAYPFFHWFKLSYRTSMVFASRGTLLLAIFGFVLMARDPGDSTADHFRTGSLVAFNPYVIYAHAGYAEPLYFALFCFAYVLARRRQWIASGSVAAVLSVTRVVGFLFSLCYAVMWLRDPEARVNWRRTDLDRVIGLLLCPLGAAVFLLYMYHLTGDALAAQAHIHVAWHKIAGDPFSVLLMALHVHGWARVWGAMSVVGLLASAWLIKLGKPELGIFLAITILLALSANYWGTARYLWWQPPFLYAIHCFLKRHAGWWNVYIAFAAAMGAFMIIAWFSGHNFVV